MRKFPLALLFLLVLGDFSFVYAAPNYTLTATCDVTTHTMHYVSSGVPAGTRYYDAWQGIVGFGELMNGSSASSDTYDQVNTCDNLDDSLTPTLLHVNSYWFVTVYKAADVTDFRNYFSGVTGSPPNQNYGISLCTTASCISLVDLTVGSSTALGYFDSGTASTTFATIGASCSGSGNIFSYGICTAFAYLFVPSTSILDQWSSLASTTENRFPFSWVSSVKFSLSSLTASSTANAPMYSVNLANLGIGSTSPIGNLLPNFTAFSSTTVLSYISPSLWSAGQLLIGSVLWLALGFDIYATVRRRHATV